MENYVTFSIWLPGVCSICWILCHLVRALIDVLTALQWKCSHLLDTKQPKFTESSTPLYHNFPHPSKILPSIPFASFHIWVDLFHFIQYCNNKSNIKQECIPVGCILTIHSLLYSGGGELPVEWDTSWPSLNMSEGTPLYSEVPLWRGSMCPG